MRKFLCYDTNDAASGKINVSANGVLRPNATVPSINGTAYQQLVTDGNGNTKWEDRLAYESITEKNLIDNASVTVDRDSGASENVSCDWELIVGEKYTVRDDDFVVEGIVAQEGNGYKFLVWEDGACSLYQYPGYWKYSSRTNGQHTLTLSGPSASTKKIDAQYLYQADWNENDSSSPAYILNKPESLGGGVTWFTISFTSSSWDGGSSNIKKGEVWATGSSTTSEELFDAFKNGLVRARITDTTNPSRADFGTLSGVSQFTSCGATSNTFRFVVDKTRDANISFS